MLDQSFSGENFRIILDVENRKGKYLEKSDFFDGEDLFEESRLENEKIIELNKEIREEKKRLKKIDLKVEGDYIEIERLNEEKEKTLENREEILKKILNELSFRVDIDSYKIILNEGQIKFGSQLYVVDNKPEHYFVLKLLQRNIYKTFKVKQSERRSIISQLKLHLNDGFPKIVVRTDIKSFYESIPHKQLLAKIEENSLLSSPSKRIVKDILNQYWKILIRNGVKTLTDERVGIPRGVGISAYLSELYMRDFDKRMYSYKNVTFYSRYVDDIIIIITPEIRSEIKTLAQYKNEIKNILLNSCSLHLNIEKTSLTDLRKENQFRLRSQKYSLTYLGYQFEIRYVKTGNDIEKIPLQINMSSDKLLRYISKIETSFSDYRDNIIKYGGNENGTNKLLIQRLKFLTNNFQLYRRKSNVFVGIYFSNEFLTNTEDLKILDEKLRNETLATINISKVKLISEINNMSFTKGFEKKVFCEFRFESFINGKMLKIWKNL